MLETDRVDGSKRLAFAVGGFIVAMFAIDSWWSQPIAPIEVEAARAFSADTIRQCREAVTKAKADGLIRAEPSSDRIDVEDHLWTGLPADVKRLFLQGQACAKLGRPLNDTEHVVAYGYRSGKRLATATSLGVTFE